MRTAWWIAPGTHPPDVALVLLHLGDDCDLAADALEDQYIVRPQVRRVAIGQIAVGGQRDGAGGQPHAARPQQHRDQLRVGVQNLHRRFMFDTGHD
jgi:hypothetical protein